MPSELPEELSVMSSCMPSDRVRVLLWRESGDALAVSINAVEAQALIRATTQELQRLSGSGDPVDAYYGVELEGEPEMVLAVGDGWGGGCAFAMHGEKLTVGLPANGGAFDIRTASRDQLPEFLAELRTPVVEVISEEPVDLQSTVSE